MHSRNAVADTFRQLLARLDPLWSERDEEEREEWVSWYARTAKAISLQFGRSLRDPCHDAADVFQEILLKLLTKFGPAEAPHRLLMERPCMRNLMEWKGLDRVDWENAARRNARLRASLPDEEVGVPDGRFATPDHSVEILDEERAFRRAIRDPQDREAYLLFRTGRSYREVAHLLDRGVRETKALKDDLAARLSASIT